jgi:catechol 2,3-dioxygenase-like lactoylglutathione lyase family enzyme
MMKPPSVEQFVTFIYTERFEACAEFYEKVLQLPLVLDQRACRIYRAAGDAFLGLCRGLKEDAPGRVVLTLVAQDVDGWYAYLKGKGVPFEKTPAYNEDFDIYHLFVRDPSDHLVEIQTFRDPAWPKPVSVGSQAGS